MLKTTYESVNPAVVFEEYYGKTGNLLKAEKLLDKICNRIKACESELQLYKLNINESAENREVCKLFEKEFGFKNMSIFWSSESAPNAYTILGSFVVDPTPDAKHANVRDSHKYFDETHSYHCVINVVMNLVRKLELTGGECMGVILHEIGHNFDSGLSMLSMRLLPFMANPISEVLYSTLIKYVKIPLSASIQNKLPGVTKMLSAVPDLLYNLNVIPGPLLLLVTDIASNPAILVQRMFGGIFFKTEYNADEFPASYGYAVPYSKALDKMSDPVRMRGYMESGIYQIPVLRALYDITETTIMLLYQGLFDVHPFDENRILNLRKKLQKDYNNPDIPKKLKPEIKKQIELVDKIYKQNVEETGEGLPMMRMRKLVMRAILDDKTK